MEYKRSKDSNRPNALQTELEETHKKLEKLSRLHIAAWINASADPSDNNVAQAQRFDEQFEVLRERYEALYCKNELIIQVTHPNKLN